MPQMKTDLFFSDYYTNVATTSGSDSDYDYEPVSDRGIDKFQIRNVRKVDKTILYCTKTWDGPIVKNRS